MQTIKLPNGQWTFDEAAPLGKKGGYGEVFQGMGPDGSVAVKRLKLDAGHAAHRELNIAGKLTSRSLNHVVPVLDSGQDSESDRYFVIMPVCDESLQDRLDREGVLDVAEAISVITQISEGLIEVGDIVHRDLKPANVLLLNGTWRVADFGIAKFVADATSMQTLRGSGTAPYAAPEQFVGERPTPQTDVYALGCILFALLNGKPPFWGSEDDVVNGHLYGEIPTLNGLDQRTANFARTLLRKPPGGRPSIQRCRDMFASWKASDVTKPAHVGLMAAAERISIEKAAQDAAEAEAAAKSRQHAALVQSALRELDEIAERLCQSVLDASPEASADGMRVGGEDVSRGVRLGDATFRVRSQPRLARLTELRPSPRTGFSTLAAVAVANLQQEVRQRSAVGNWAANLVYAEMETGTGFRWYEIGFFMPFGSGPMTSSAFTLDQLVLAVGPAMGNFGIAYGPFPIDAEDEDGFLARWLSLIGRAATGELYQPGSLPLPPNFFG